MTGNERLGFAMRCLFYLSILGTIGTAFVWLMITTDWSSYNKPLAQATVFGLLRPIWIFVSGWLATSYVSRKAFRSVDYTLWGQFGWMLLIPFALAFSFGALYLIAELADHFRP